ncbi:hypothetical protein PABG_04046 [Paracoccidioides brasiliensis Pb03]|nr:hypothetical protein PABG_04046 [Paracoccidioides brasiliensis Pb03]
MASNGFTSPFPISHDTLGASFLNTPVFMPSSPPRLMDSSQDLILPTKKPSSARASAANSANAARRRKVRYAKASGSPYSSDGSDSEANFSDYTFDLSRLSDYGSDRDNNNGESNENEKSSPKKKPAAFHELRGPRDFTLNMVELVRGTDSLPANNEDNASKPGPMKDVEELRSNTVIAEHTINEYSEMGAPLDMSTPARVLSRRNVISRNSAPLDKIDEPSIQSPPNKSPQPDRELSQQVAESFEEHRLHEEIEQLRQQLRKKDETIDTNKRRVLEAASAAQQIQHLQSELQKEYAALKERDAHLSTLSPHDEEVENLRTQLQQKDDQLKKIETDALQLKSLQEESKRLRDKDIQSRTLPNTSEGDPTQDRQGNNETVLKMSLAISNKDAQIQKHAAEIDQLRANQDAQYLEMDKLDSELETVSRECEALEEKTESLLKAVRQSEIKNNTIQAELDVANLALDSQFKAIKILASEVSADIRTNDTSFSQIVDALKAAYHSRKTTSVNEATKSSERARALEKELSEARLHLRNSLPSDRMQTLQLEGTRQELSESRALNTVLQREISRLSAKIEGIVSEQTKLQDTLYKTTQERDKAILDLENLRKEQNMIPQQPSPPLSPAPGPSGAATCSCHINHDALLKSHETELNNVHSAHATAFSTLRNSHAETVRTFQNVITATQARETKLDSELSKLRAASASLEQRVAELQYERERLESVVEAKESAALAIDRKFASVLKKREEEWERRVDRLLKDQERMGKVLMWTWGEKEVGGASNDGAGDDGKAAGPGKENKPPQAYRYKYVERKGGRIRDE